MNLSLLLPTALAALAAIAVPVLIHLSRRSEHKIIDFAALRWLQAFSRPQRKLVFQELLLLLLRILLIVAIALFLAKPVMHALIKPQHWVVVVPGAEYQSIKDIASDKSVAWHWLSDGYPSLDAPMPKAPQAFSSALRELDRVLPKASQLTLIVPEQLSGLDAERPRLSRPIAWRVVPGKMAADATAELLPTPPRLSIRYDHAHTDSLKYFRAANAAWHAGQNPVATQTLSIEPADATLPSQQQTLLWLVSGPVPDSVRQWIRSGGVAVLAHEAVLPDAKKSVVVWRNTNGQALLSGEPMGNGRVLQFTQSLSPPTMPELWDADFADRLQLALRAEPTAPSRALALNHVPRSGAPAWPEIPKPLNDWLKIIIAVLFVLERWRASAAKRWATP